MAAKKTHGASSFSSHLWRYDVFLSFRGEDTRTNFTDHLYFAMKDAGINVFKDDDEIPTGEDIKSELLEAIEGSRFLVIVFSPNYAASRWCLEELVHILKCSDTMAHVVLPIFYKVDPSDVRNKRGSYAEAFYKHEQPFEAEMHKKSRWTTALFRVGSLRGWDLRNSSEAQLVRDIVKTILNRLNNTYLNVPLYQVGLCSRLKKLISISHSKVSGVRIIGICEMGGMGKTTLAKVVYNHFLHVFPDRSFLGNVREMSKQPGGLIRLQEQLLFDILKSKKIKINNVDRGSNVIQATLGHRKVLVILDDVDELEQLSALGIKRDWLGKGSTILITTRDRHLLKLIGADDIYTAEELNDGESLELFCWHAFKQGHPKEDYVELSKDVISYCKGLPLALEVLGSFLFERSVEEWRSALDKLKRIPHDQIQKILRISFDGLKDDAVENIFLDFACFFLGMDKEYVFKILDGCGFFPEIGISILIGRCLLSINEYNKFMMHDLLRDMGREIVRQESCKDPGNRSRLWFHNDVHDVLKKHTGTKEVEGLITKFPTSNDMHFSTEAFANMQNLRLLQLNYVHVTGDYNHLSKELRWICWHGFPLKFIPNSFHVEKLVAIDIRYSNLRQVWKEIKVLENLKVLNLSHSNYLIKTPNFSGIPNLEKLKLKDCSSLVEIHPSIGNLCRLVLLDMRDCKQLKNLPSFGKLISLEILNVSGCSKIEELPEDIGAMEALIELLVEGTAIRQVPSSIVHLKNLRDLSLSGCKGLKSSSWASRLWSWVLPRKSPDSISLLPSSLLGLSSLRRLGLRDCNLSDDGIPKDLGSLSCLELLDLGSNNFHSLPASIGNLPKLWCLDLDYCTSLQSLPELPTSLNRLSASYCISLERFPNLSRFPAIPELFLANCHKLVEIPGLEKLDYSSSINMEGCNNVGRTFKETLLQVRPIALSNNGGIFLSGNEIPSWFHHQSMSPSVSFQAPPTLVLKKRALAVTVVYACDTVSDNSKGLELPSWPKNYAIPGTRQDHMWVGHFGDFLLGGGDQVDVEVTPEVGVKVKKCGIHPYDHEESSTQSDGGELSMYDSAWKGKAIIVGDDDDNDDVLPPPRSYECNVKITTYVDGCHHNFWVRILSKSSAKIVDSQKECINAHDDARLGLDVRYSDGIKAHSEASSRKRKHIDWK